jgi:hypothetical protein
MTNLASQLRDCRTAAQRAVVLQKGQAPEVAMQKATEWAQNFAAWEVTPTKKHGKPIEEHTAKIRNTSYKIEVDQNGDATLYVWDDLRGAQPVARGTLAAMKQKAESWKRQDAKDVAAIERVANYSKAQQPQVAMADRDQQELLRVVSQVADALVNAKTKCAAAQRSSSIRSNPADASVLEGINRLVTKALEEAEKLL